MLIDFNPFSSQPYFDLPFQLSNWIGLFILAGVLGWGFLKWRENPVGRSARQWGLTLFLMATTPLTLIIFNFYLPQSGALPIPNLPIEAEEPLVFLLSAIPWVMAGGMVGVAGAGLVGLASGFMLGMFVTHSLFTPLEVAGLALIYGAAVRQCYRTGFFRWLRQPFVAAVLLSLVYIPVFLLIAFLSIPGILAERLDYALAQNWMQVFAKILPLYAAGFLAQLVYWIFPLLWPRPAKLTPSPAETSLQTRFMTITLPMVLILVLVLTLADWLVAGYAARQMMEDRLGNTTRIAAESVPYFLEAGQSFILNMATSDLVNLPDDAVEDELAYNIKAVSYFHQLTLFDAAGAIRGSYPQSSFSLNDLTDEEELAIGLAIKGIRLQIYTVPPASTETGGNISFIAAILDEAGIAQGVLLGRADLKINPFTQPALTALASLGADGGEGFILDDAGQILYRTSESTALSSMDLYIDKVNDQPVFFEDFSPTGTRQLVYYQPVVGRPWAVVATMPARVAQQTSLEIAVPLLAILGLFTMLAYLMLRFSLGSVTQTLKQLGGQATRIAQGELSSAAPVTGADEIGALGKSFEQMRLSLKARLDELNKLLNVSQGVAAKLDIYDAVHPILEAALSEDAISARAVLIQGVRMDIAGDKLVTIGAGPVADQFSHLDSQVFELMRQQEVLTIQNTTRVRRISSLDHQLHPAALIGLALYHENTYYGALWIGYQKPRQFEDEEVRFLSTLAGEAAVAAANANLYASAEIGRRRLEAVLTSNPEPIMVFDDKDRLLLLNPAALQVTGLIATPTVGLPAQEVVSSAELAALLTGPIELRIATREVKLPNGNIYHASVAPVMGENQQIGKVCVMRDISHYKELDSIKSDFVATVSHDLRSPLALMRGYTTMMSMVGELNDQQKSYVAKMVHGIEDMSRLVNNLLDLGRLDSGIKLKLSQLQPGVLVEQVINQLTPQANQKKIRLAFEPPEEELPSDLTADVALIQQALINLVENAIKYTKVGGEVIVRLELQDNKLAFQVTDSGIGIAPLDLPRLFEKFYRSERREAHEQRGTGLGLAIVKSIAERHGGEVVVESQLGKGSVFTLRIPLQEHPPVKPLVGMPQNKG
ncbi:MAG: HAMP domain-containing protein [Chloroflexi bacterium]|nr:MAG: HAMP domain-containing protein [Chloroflexota bacterium]